ncbi:MAG: tRNA (N(6)-L-threonylcarbamoyladenosine(37)-C(2))-methylthiotransferase MtaB [Desulforhopalus sp.]
MKNVFITTLGCKVNQYESAAFKTALGDNGLTIVKGPENADLIIINTCAVTAGAGAQSRQTIRQALKKNPTADIIITGCYAEIAANEISADKELQGRGYSLIGNSKKDALVSHALGKGQGVQDILMGAIGDAREICRLPVRRFGERSRAYLRVQDGCESYCTYCIVPYTRGPSRSLPMDEVIEQARVFTEQGHREIVLTGIHLGYYGKDLDKHCDLVTLLDKLTVATPQTSYRISSLEPLEISDTLLSLMQQRSNIQPHFHIPLQSGHDEILARMNRRYTVEQFRDVITLCHERLPDAAIGIDILAGFPGETDEHFSEALHFLRSLDFTYLHVFPYSIRPGTVAAGFNNQVLKKIKETRVAALRDLSDQKRSQFYQRQLGRIRPVLVEGQRDNEGLLKGFTDNYVAIRFDGPDRLLNSITAVKLMSRKDSHVVGERVKNHEN